MINEVQPGHYMELTTILGVLLAVLQLVIIAFCKVLWSNFQEVKRRGETTAAEVAQLKSGCAKELAQFKLDCAEKYSTKDELAKAMETLGEAIKAVFAKLERIEDKLDNKQDKP